MINASMKVESFNKKRAFNILLDVMTQKYNEKLNNDK